MFCFAVLCHGQADPNREFTGELPNGRFWNSSTELERLAYVAGIRDAFLLTDGQPEWWAKGFTIGDYVKDINKLFAEGENVNIPMMWAFRYCTNKLKGEMSKDAQERALTNLRLMARDWK